MLIVDAQIHLWESRTGPPHHRSEPLQADRLIEEMDAAGIDRVVNCPAIWDPRANEIAIEACRKYPDRIRTMGWIPLMPDGDGERLAHWKKQPGMLGLRFVVLNSETAEWLRAGRLDWLWKAAERFDIPVGLTVPGMLPTIYSIAERFPELKLVIDHMGLGPTGKAPEAFDHFPDLLKMAKLPNVTVKATAAPAYAADAYPFRSVHTYLHQIFDVFGPQRMFWGTDITRMNCSWSDCKKMFTEELMWLAGDDLSDVMGKAICRWLGWETTV